MCRDGDCRRRAWDPWPAPSLDAPPLVRPGTDGPERRGASSRDPDDLVIGGRAGQEDYAVLLCPTLTRPPVPLGELNKVGQDVPDLLARYIPFTYWVNVAGQPAISLPPAWSGNGLPIGVQLVGRQLDERTLIGLAAQLEQRFPWTDRRPPIS